MVYNILSALQKEKECAKATNRHPNLFENRIVIPPY